MTRTPSVVCMDRSEVTIVRSYFALLLSNP